LFQKTEVQPSLQCSTSLEVIDDIVISAHPSSPPLSVFILYQMLACQKRVLMHSFVHSSIRDSAVPDLSTDYSCLVAPVANRNHFQLGLSIIWKDGMADFCNSTCVMQFYHIVTHVCICILHFGHVWYYGF